jgi:hypothetical protein
MSKKIDFIKEQLDLEERFLMGVGKLLLECSMTVDEFYEARLHKEILTEKDIKKALTDWGIIASLPETKKYIELVQKIKSKLPLYLSNEILKNE